MRKVFSSNEVSETVVVRDALARAGIEATVLNEYSGTSAVPGFRPPAEVWVRDEADQRRAKRVVAETIAAWGRNADARPWICAGCREENPESFELCWNCGREKERTDR